MSVRSFFSSLFRRSSTKTTTTTTPSVDANTSPTTPTETSPAKTDSHYVKLAKTKLQDPTGSKALDQAKKEEEAFKNSLKERQEEIEEAKALLSRTKTESSSSNYVEISSLSSNPSASPIPPSTDASVTSTTTDKNADSHYQKISRHPTEHQSSPSAQEKGAVARLKSQKLETANYYLPHDICKEIVAQIIENKSGTVAIINGINHKLQDQEEQNQGTYRYQPNSSKQEAILKAVTNYVTVASDKAAEFKNTSYQTTASYENGHKKNYNLPRHAKIMQETDKALGENRNVAYTRPQQSQGRTP